MLHELHRRACERGDGDAERREQRIGEALRRARAPPVVSACRPAAAVAVLLEVIDERGLELDSQRRASRRSSATLERAGPAIGEQLLELAMLERQQEQPIRDARRERDIVGDDDRGDAELLHLLADEPREHAHAMRIEPDRRLVEEQQLAPAREHARDRDALGLTARERGHRRPGSASVASSPTRSSHCRRVAVIATVAWRSASSRLPRTSR